MKRRLTARWILAACWIAMLAIAFCWGPPAAVAQVAEGIAVTGVGEVFARPNLIEIDLGISGKAELTADAQVKFRDAKKRVLEALEKLNIEGVSHDELSLTIQAGNSMEQQQRMMNGQQQQHVGKNQIEVSSVLRLRLKEIRDVPAEELIKTIGRLLDTAQDCGVTVGPSPSEVMRAMRYGQFVNNTMPVRFIVADLTALREKAYEQAVADARSRAGRLAKLNHLKLGAAMSVQEVMVAGDNPNASSMVNNPFGYMPYGVANQNTAQAATEGEPPRIASTNLGGIPIQVKLLVRFAIQQPDPATAQQ